MLIALPVWSAPRPISIREPLRLTRKWCVVLAPRSSWAIAASSYVAGMGTDGDADKGSAPKAFVSHGSPDKKRFVLGFAERLRTQGVDAWVDEWEIAPGDSLVDRIFEDGIGDADVFIVVLSENTVDRPWVHDELNAGVVRRIEGKCKLIPVVLDGVEVPETLKHVVWQPIGDIDNYDAEFDKIVRSIFGHTHKPPLGDPPRYATKEVLVDGLPPDAATLLGLIVDAAIERGDRFMGTFDPIVEAAATEGLTADAVYTAAARLGHDDYLDVTSFGGTRVSHAEVTWSGLLAWLKATGVDVDEIGGQVAVRLVNSDDRELEALAAAVEQPKLLVDLVLTSLEQQDLISVGRYMGGAVKVHSVSPALRTFLE